MRHVTPRFAIIVFGLLMAQVATSAEVIKEPFSQAKQKVDDGKAVLVDVREKSEWDQGHVDGAIHLPLSSIRNGISPEVLATLPKDKDLYTYCVVGKRALAAGKILELHGYQVWAIKPGYNALISAGFPRAQE